ncbi:MAG: glutamine synthetase [Eggerthellaceae bacterium]|nr:glutamine synthetase [Eggerthellaceae bacterium]
MSSSHEQDFVLKTVKSRDVHFIRLWFVDVMGRMKSFAITPPELERAFSEGMGFDGSCIEGFRTLRESDTLAFPDASTFQVLPWRPQSNAVGRMFCEIRTPDGRPFEGDSRQVLERVMLKANDMGYLFNVGSEIEFFYFRDSKGAETLDNGGLFDLTSLDCASDLRRDTILTLEKMGIPVEYSHHESGPSQHEIDLRFTDGLSMADAVMTYKLVVKEVAHKHGVFASFMPKPIEGVSGSGMHLHMSLSDLDGRNAFFDADDPSGFCLSRIAKSFIAGVLKYACEMCLVTNQYVNSYKRLAGGAGISSRVAWAGRSRDALIRVPGYRPSCEEACRIEFRGSDPAANPYLAFAALLAAGLKGIEDGLELPPPVDGAEPEALPNERFAERGARTLPTTLGEAVSLFEGSELMREVLGRHIHGYLAKAKRAEWEEYQRVVTEWERDRYLAVL